MVLLELVSGRRPIEEEYGEGKDIVYWVLNHVNDRESVLRVLDDKVVTDSVQDGMLKVLKVAILCTTKLPSVRPSMREVVKMLIDADPCTFRSPDSNADKNGKVFLWSLFSFSNIVKLSRFKHDENVGISMHVDQIW